MKKIQNPEVAEVFKAYPKKMREKLLFLRRLVLETSSETKGVDIVKETLKWGEPSYVAEGGSTVRLGWKRSRPDHYAMYFICRTNLVDTFREIYGDRFTFEGNRAIVFSEHDEVPVTELKHCIALSLTYHRIKHLPMLGI